DRLRRGEPVRSIRDVRGTAYALRKGEWEGTPRSRYVGDGGAVLLPGYDEVKAGARAFAAMSRAFQMETNPGNARPLLQPHGAEAVFLNPPASPLETAQMDELYDLPFARAAHWSYDAPV